MIPRPVVTSYLLAALAVPVVLHFHLLSAVVAGLAVHVLTVKLARRLQDAGSHGPIIRVIVLTGKIHECTKRC